MMSRVLRERRRRRRERADASRVFCALNSAVRRQRRRLMTLAAVLALAGAVVTVHSAMSHDHTGDVIVTCLAVAETALVAVGGALALGPRPRRLRWPLPEPPARWLAPVSAMVGVYARAGPPRLQVFRL